MSTFPFASSVSHTTCGMEQRHRYNECGASVGLVTCLGTDVSPWQQIGMMFKWAHKYNLNTHTHTHTQAEHTVLCLCQCYHTGGGCDLSRSPRQWMSLCTAAVQPLPTNRTASFSVAFTAFLTISLEGRRAKYTISIHAPASGAARTVRSGTYECVKTLLLL